MAAKKGRSKKIQKPANYRTYIGKVLKQVYPQGVTLSSLAAEQVNALLCDLEKRLTTKSIEVVHLHRKGTVGAKHLQVATQVILPAELGRMASGEAVKAVRAFEETK